MPDDEYNSLIKISFSVKVLKPDAIRTSNPRDTSGEQHYPMATVRGEIRSSNPSFSVDLTTIGKKGFQHSGHLGKPIQKQDGYAVDVTKRRVIAFG
ncbi:MAG: hypothetical protein LJE65_08180 [Desulfobacteraceae bacterium]|nr:hypothetical protein [Desulfobacteraceae bacterium]